MCKAFGLAIIGIWMLALTGCQQQCYKLLNGNPVEVSGELKKWHRVTLTFTGPKCSETGQDNPFTDYLLIVTFTNGDKQYEVPGFFAADGNAAQTGASAGNKWRVHFMPDQVGTWKWQAQFYKFPDIIAIKIDDVWPIDGLEGAFDIAPSDKTGTDFRARGRLEYLGQRYLRFAGDGGYFLKMGADSPENFLAYHEFDGTYDSGPLLRGGEAQDERAFLHKYEPHIQDYCPGDPSWQGGRGKGIIGALNYLATKGVNSLYFVTYNVDGGDGKDVWPWTAPGEKFRFDCSKLDQWEIVFSHMDKLGIMLHVVTQETENDQALDGGALGSARRLYYRELIARFAHHPAIVWNIGEENTNTNIQREAFARYIKTTDPYDHPIICHTHPDKYDEVYQPLLGYEYFDGLSLQIAPEQSHDEAVKWIERSAETGRQWFVCHDETTPAGQGVVPDAVDADHDRNRIYALWGNLMAGGAGCEWYFGYQHPNNDLNCEDFCSRDRMWDISRYAVEFFQKYVPFDRMAPADELVSDGWCLAGDGVYVVYLPEGGETEMELAAGKYEVFWYDPLKGGDLIRGGRIQAGSSQACRTGKPPYRPQGDWAILIRAVE